MIAVAAAAGAVAGLVWWRRRASAPAATPAQIGLSDGSVHILEPGDPARGELEMLAARVSDALSMREQ